MARKYTLKRRAEQQDETRRRIVEAAVDLHGSIGPARTTVSMIAERAGVQRHTYYAHFPEERGLFMACSSLALERDPLPEAEPWRRIGDPLQRVETGLSAIYDWYGRNAELTGCVLRDAEYHPPTREIMALRFGPPMAAWREVLGDAVDRQRQPLLDLALSYFTWRSLVRDNGLDAADVVALIARTLLD